jgi:imidazolonepropionase
MMNKQPADLIVHNSSTMLTLAGPNRPRVGVEMRDLSPIANGAVVISEGRIVAVGGEELSAVYEAREIIDAEGRLVMPGFVDVHTHLIFAGSREDEMARKIAGESYLDILKDGGGINATVRAVRAATEAQLYDSAHRRLTQLLMHGTTTVEIKSGYGLNADAELKLLRVISRLQKNHPSDVVATFLGAHIVPDDQKRGDYLNWLCEKAPALVKPYARFFDVFCEEEAFSLKETERLLNAARRAGFRLKVHAGQFHALGASGLAADLGAVSVDHCDHLADDEITRMRRSGAIAVLLPGAAFFTDGDFADARGLIDPGVPVAVASDFNPGSCPSFSMQMMITIACLKMKMTAAEAITAATINAAWAIDKGEQVGSLEPGKQADLLIMDIQNAEQLPYYFGVNLVHRVIKAGKVISYS